MRTDKGRTFTKAMACALSAVMFLAPVNANAAELDSAWKDKEAVTVDATADREVVTVTVDLTANTGLTSGQTVIFYDKDELDFDWISDGNYFEITDVNLDYTEDDKTGISYAWVATKPSSRTGEMLTIGFKAKNATDGKVITLDTVVKDAYADQESLLNGVAESEKQITLDIKPIQIGWVTIAPGSPVDKAIGGLIGAGKRIGTIIGRLFP